jgi:hypothetical protein
MREIGIRAGAAVAIQDSTKTPMLLGLLLGILATGISPKKPVFKTKTKYNIVVNELTARPGEQVEWVGGEAAEHGEVLEVVSSVDKENDVDDAQGEEEEEEGPDQEMATLVYALLGNFSEKFRQMFLKAKQT